MPNITSSTTQGLSTGALSDNDENQEEDDCQSDSEDNPDKYGPLTF